MPIKKLKEQGFELATYFYNPNIHPYREYKKRRNTFVEYMQMISMPYAMYDDYDLAGFLAGTSHQVGTRCGFCYEMRFEKAAAFAAENGFEAYATTLTVSPYQNHQLIQEVGERVGEKYGVKFYYQDFREYFHEGQDIAKELELYLQGYCGCIYSEKDRYFKAKKEPLILSMKPKFANFVGGDLVKK